MREFGFYGTDRWSQSRWNRNLILRRAFRRRAACSPSLRRPSVISDEENISIYDKGNIFFLRLAWTIARSWFMYKFHHQMLIQSHYACSLLKRKRPVFPLDGADQPASKRKPPVRVGRQSILCFEKDVSRIWKHLNITTVMKHDSGIAIRLYYHTCSCVAIWKCLTWIQTLRAFRKCM